MINTIIEFSIKNKFLISLFTVALIGMGIYSMSTVNLGSVPDITNNQVQVMTVSQNLATEDIEQFVTYPVELAMGNLPGVQEIRSISRFGLSVVTIVFDDKMGTYLPRQLVQEKLNDLRSSIPENFGTPTMGPISTGLGQIYEYTIQPKKGYDSIYSPRELRSIQDWIVKRQLTLLDGVVEVNSYGGYIKQYEVAINPEKLNSLDITISEVYDALSKNNINTGGAYIEKNRMSNFIRGEGLIRSLDDIRKIAVKTESGIPITIGNLAEKVHFGHQVRYGSFTQDGEEAVGGMIMMLKGSNPNAVIQNVKKRMEEVENSLPEGLEIKTIIDRSELISRTTDTVIKNLLEGALIVIFVLVLLLGSLRGGIITATTIPLSLLFAFILMKQFNVWANLMSLGAIDFGIIIDGAVIIIEGTVHEIQKKIRTGKVPFSQKLMDKISFKAGSTMMGSAFFGQIIILIVFAPILFLTGVEGKMFQPMAYTFGFAMIGAIVLCLTYVPMMSALLMKPIKNKGNWFGKLERGLESMSDRIILALQQVYFPVLKGALRLKVTVILVAILLLGIAAITFSRMGGEFVPQLDEGDIAMQALIRPGSSLSESEDVSIKIENLLRESFPEIKTVTARIGVADIPTDPMPMDIADMYLILEKDRDKWVTANTKEDLIGKIKKMLEDKLTGVNLVFTQPVELRFNELLEGVREDIAVKLYGEDLEILTRKVEEMANIIRTVPGAGDVNPERTSGLPQMTIKYNRAKIAQYGLDIQKINQYVSSAFAGGVAGVVFEGEKRFELVIRFDEASRQSIDDLRNLYIDLPDGTQVPIKEVADIEYVPGPMQISRENTYRRTYVGVNTRGRDVESVVKDIKQKLDAELELPAGYYITYGGEFENLERAKNRLAVVVPIALILIFVLLYFALKSFTQSVMIFVAIPLAAIGGIFTLWLRGMPFSISAGVGFIVLFGVAVLNGLVLINRFNALKAEGVASIRSRVLTGTKERLRPILLTATTDICGFLPMAFSHSAGAEVQRPLATVVIGGMITATLLTLIVLPIIYEFLEKRKNMNRTSFGFNDTYLMPAIVIAVGIFMTPQNLIGQENSDSIIAITVEEALSKAKKSYPEIRSSELYIKKTKALEGTALDLGESRLFTGAEEFGNGNSGVFTVIGFQQQQIDIFGTKARENSIAQKIKLAEKNYNWTILQLENKVRISWARVYARKKILEIYGDLDSVFSDIERASEINLETESISKLEFLATTNQAKEVKILKDQAYRDYLESLQLFNQWFSNSENLFTVENIENNNVYESVVIGDNQINQHPVYEFYDQKIEVADAEIEIRKSDFFPKFQLQYALQNIQGKSGFNQFQLGIEIPIFYGPEKARIEASRVKKNIAEYDAQRVRIELNTEFKSLKQKCFKWYNSWRYYRDEAMPLAEEQRTGALTAYNQGAISYTTFLQNVKAAMQIEINAWEAFEQYIICRNKLEYFLANY